MTVHSDEIREIVQQVLMEERQHHAENMDTTVLRTVSAILTSFGINEDEKKELRQDFIHLRKWRKSVERVEQVGWTTAITVIVTGILGALWIGAKSLLGK